MYLQTETSRLRENGDELTEQAHRLSQTVWEINQACRKLQPLTGMENCCRALLEEMRQIDISAYSMMVLGESLRRIAEHYSVAEELSLRSLEGGKRSAVVCRAMHTISGQEVRNRLARIMHS